MRFKDRVILLQRKLNEISNQVFLASKSMFLKRWTTLIENDSDFNNFKFLDENESFKFKTIYDVSNEKIMQILLMYQIVYYCSILLQKLLEEIPSELNEKRLKKIKIWIVNAKYRWKEINNDN